MSITLSGEFSSAAVWPGTRPRRFVVDPRQLRVAERPSLGRKLTRGSRLHVSRLRHQLEAAATEEIWRDYNRRADMENRIAELKHDWAAR